MAEGTVDSTLPSTPPTLTDSRVLDLLRPGNLKRLVLQFTPDSLEDLIKVIGHEAMSLANYNRFGMFSNIAIETTSICNRRCDYCPVSISDLYQSRPLKPMDDKTYHNVIDQLAAVNYQGTVALQHYGEPLLDPKLESRITYARKQLPNAFLVMNSNGDRLDPGRFVRLVKAGIDLIHVTNHNKNGELEPSLQALQAYLKDHPELRKHFKMRAGVSSYYNRGGLIEAQNPRKLTHCVDESYSANVDVYGNVNEKGIVSIWYGKEFKDLRSRKKRGHFDLDICKKCVGE